MTIKYFNGGYYNDRTHYYDAGVEGVSRAIGYEENPPPPVEGMCSHVLTRALHEPGIIARADEIDKGWEYAEGRFAPPTNRCRSADLASWPEWQVVINSLFADYYPDLDKDYPEQVDLTKHNIRSALLSVDGADPRLIHADLEYVLGVKVTWIDLEATLEARRKWFEDEKIIQDKRNRIYQAVEDAGLDIRTVDGLDLSPEAMRVGDVDSIVAYCLAHAQPEEPEVELTAIDPETARNEVAILADIRVKRAQGSKPPGKDLRRRTQGQGSAADPGRGI